MQNLIDRDAVIAYLKRKKECAMTVYAEAVVKNAPTVDAVPVVHGEWKYVYYRSDVIGIKCSICGGICGGNEWKFCPHCGAKMDGGKKDV